jgi:hypothetical protein
MQETFRELTHQLLLTVPSANIELARMWVNRAFRRIRDRRAWSWKYRTTQIFVPEVVGGAGSDQTGEGAIIAFGDDLLTINGGVFTPGMIGRQVRLSGDPHLVTIKEYLTPTQVRIDQPWLGADIIYGSYRIFLAYITPPEDFFAWDTVVSSSSRQRLHLDVDRTEIDHRDPVRDRIGGWPSLLSFYDYSTSVSGVVKDAIQVKGSGAAPVSSGDYTGGVSAVFTVEVLDSEHYRWRKNSGPWTSSVYIDQSLQHLQEGVYVTWVPRYIQLPEPLPLPPAAGDLFTIVAEAISSPGLPRYELYPHQTVRQILPARYIRYFGDLSDTNAVIPRAIRGDVLLEGALVEAAIWPGPSGNEINPYAQVSRRVFHEERFTKMVEELAREDNEIHQQNLFDHAEFVPLPWGGGESSPFPGRDEDF